MSVVVMNLAVAPTMKTFVWAFFLVVVLPVLITGGAVFFTNKSMTLSVTGIVTAMSVIFFVVLSFFLLRNEIVLNVRGLTVKAAFYERQVSDSDIVWTKSSIIDLSRDAEFLPRLRVNGIGLPGYQAGWFRLANGTRAFVLMTHGPLVFLPVRGGEGLLLSVAESSPLLEKIQFAESGR